VEERGFPKGFGKIYQMIWLPKLGEDIETQTDSEVIS
jgi:hypothetical protein